MNLVPFQAATPGTPGRRGRFAQGAIGPFPLCFDPWGDLDGEFDLDDHDECPCSDGAPPQTPARRRTAVAAVVEAA